MEEEKKVYEVVGKTFYGSFCCSGFSSDLKVAIDSFVKRYPRFEGRAQIREQIAKDVGYGMIMADHSKWKALRTVETIKELKEYLLG